MDTVFKRSDSFMNRTPKKQNSTLSTKGVIMFYLISGAGASGKSSIIKQLREILTNVECHDEDEIPYDSENVYERFKTWFEKALQCQKEGKDFLLTSHMPFGQLLGSKEAIKFNGISACLIDCHDYVRVKRYRNRPHFEEWPLIMDTLCWAAYHRMHAKEPEWEQRIVLNRNEGNYQHERWTSWKNDDPRWNVKVFDTTTNSIDKTVSVLVDWVNRKRNEENLLTPEKIWWK